MAILNEGINGGFTGKVGSVIGYRLNGKWVVRGLPKVSKKNKIGSAEQKRSRAKFTIMQQFLSVMLPYIRIGFNLEAKLRNISAHNAAKSYNLIHAFTDKDELDYTKIVLTKGNLPGAESPLVKTVENGLLFNWVFSKPANSIMADDQVMLMAYQAESNQTVCMYSGARRKSGAEILEIGQPTGLAYHAWISFVSDNRTAISTSQYLGTCVF
ncbi:DUF6266 family protein [Pedobacter rhodius]|uniref:DUF6266 family protein n=1 Tax=Pedobacter rhodius TaxID=3004098 RepID=A0ABT4KZH5_9SPHI|nr:DUF6266 family protein [Pedobacter sp. SJ11]MCZ4224343.1 DUF6266 family protein [Pedobacter sp. SJ11]